MVYVTSRPVHPSRSLTEKILEQPRLIQRIRYGIADSARAFLTVFNSTLLERRLAVLLGIPLNGVGPDLQRPLSLAERSREVLPIDRQFDRDRYRGLLPDDLLDITRVNRLHYSPGTETGCCST